jgi:hypothetical protein
LVVVENSFNTQPRNADYEGFEWFTGSHREYESAGNPGFSDFGPLPNTFAESGGQAAAVAIHFSYQGEDGDIWIQHFVSDSRVRGDGSNTSKLTEAIAHLVREVDANPGKFVDSVGLQGFRRLYDDDQSSNLMTSKRHQISHHISTIAMSLSDRK